MKSKKNSLPRNADRSTRHRGCTQQHRDAHGAEPARSRTAPGDEHDQREQQRHEDRHTAEHECGCCDWAKPGEGPWTPVCRVKRHDGQQYQQRKRGVGIGVLARVHVHKTKTGGQHETRGQSDVATEMSRRPHEKNRDGHPCGYRGGQAERQETRAECLERRGNQPDIERRFGVVVIERSQAGGRDPVAALDHFPGTQAVQRLVRLLDTLAVQSKPKIERGNGEYGDRQKPIVPIAEFAHPRQHHE